MFKIYKAEIALLVVGAVAALASWPIGDVLGSVGKTLITAGAMGALAVCLISILLFHDSYEDLAIHIFRCEVAYFITFTIFAILVMALTFE